jgi:hypothetical protein
MKTYSLKYTDLKSGKHWNGLVSSTDFFIMFDLARDMRKTWENHHVEIVESDMIPGSNIIKMKKQRHLSLVKGT